MLRSIDECILRGAKHMIQNHHYVDDYDENMGNCGRNNNNLLIRFEPEELKLFWRSRMR